MRVLSAPIIFKWDKGNLGKNFVKHNVTDKEAEEVFVKEPKFIFKDETHSQKEERYGLLGVTDTGRKLSIVFTIREDKVRIITARNMSKKERGKYEKIKAHTQV